MRSTSAFLDSETIGGDGCLPGVIYRQLRWIGTEARVSSQLGLTVDELSARMRTEHRATVIAANRAGTNHTNPEAGSILEQGDDLVVVAETLGDLVARQEASALA